MDVVSAIKKDAGLEITNWIFVWRGVLKHNKYIHTCIHTCIHTYIHIQVVDVVSAMKKDAGLEMTKIRVDGGMTANNLFMQTQADLVGAEVICVCVCVYVCVCVCMYCMTLYNLQTQADLVGVDANCRTGCGHMNTYIHTYIHTHRSSAHTWLRRRLLGVR